MTPYFEADGVTLYCGDCLEVMAGMEAGSVDAIVTDPPYGLSFMGKDWDKGVPGVAFWAEALRVAKPGAHLLAFGGTRTFHRLIVAIEDAGWEIRDCIGWIYGCLSDDTEILTADGWKTYNSLSCGSMVMCYNVDSDSLQLEQVQEVYKYAYSDTAYSIRSNNTDQIVSRNHRCLVKRNGAYVYKTAERLREQEVVPVLANLPNMRQDILEESGMDKEGKNKHLQQAMQRSVARPGMGEARTQRARGMDGEKQGIVHREDERSEQSGMEGRGNVLQVSRKLSGCKVRSLPAGVQSDGAQGWVRDGTPFDCGATPGPIIEEIRSGSPHRPRPREQQTGQPNAICEQQPTQKVRGAWGTVPTLATVTPIHYEGVVWCVRVPTGAFVARRNGKVFVTGNSGFPKSLDVSKAIDGEESAQWSGWGTALKPAWEPIILARKPLVGTVARNVLEYGTGAINVDGCRVATSGDWRPLRITSERKDNVEYRGNALCGRLDGSLRSSVAVGLTTKGRWPANIIHDGSEEVLAVFPDTQSGTMKAGTRHSQGGGYHGNFPEIATNYDTEGDFGSAARFFYCAKAGREDRNEGLEEFTPVQKVYNGQSAESAGCAHGSVEDKFSTAPTRNHHPTVKPTELMRYLCRMVTPPSGVVFDPFTGSGSTGKAAVIEGFSFVGAEIEEQYIEIARARIERAKLQPRLFTDEHPQPQPRQLGLDDVENVV